VKNNPSVKPIRFQAQIQKVQTLVDGGLRLTLDLSEKDLKAVTDLMECKQRGAILEVAALPIDPQKTTLISASEIDDLLNDKK